jgi:hypothetical protein
MYREDIGAKLLVHSPPVLSVIVENLLDLVWDWTWLKQEFKVGKILYQKKSYTVFPLFIPLGINCSIDL